MENDEFIRLQAAEIMMELHYQCSRKCQPQIPKDHEKLPESGKAAGNPETVIKKLKSPEKRLTQLKEKAPKNPETVIKYIPSTDNIMAGVSYHQSMPSTSRSTTEVSRGRKEVRKPDSPDDTLKHIPGVPVYRQTVLQQLKKCQPGTSKSTTEVPKERKPSYNTETVIKKLQAPNNTLMPELVSYQDSLQKQLNASQPAMQMPKGRKPPKKSTQKSTSAGRNPGQAPKRPREKPRAFVPQVPFRYPRVVPNLPPGFPYCPGLRPDYHFLRNTQYSLQQRYPPPYPYFNLPQKAASINFPPAPPIPGPSNVAQPLPIPRNSPTYFHELPRYHENLSKAKPSEPDDLQPPSLNPQSGKQYVQESFEQQAKHPPPHLQIPSIPEHNARNLVDPRISLNHPYSVNQMPNKSIDQDGIFEVPISPKKAQSGSTTLPTARGSPGTPANQANPHVQVQPTNKLQPFGSTVLSIEVLNPDVSEMVHNKRKNAKTAQKVSRNIPNSTTVPTQAACIPPNFHEITPNQRKSLRIAPQIPHIIPISPMVLNQKPSAAPHFPEKNSSYPKDPKIAPQTPHTIQISPIMLEQTASTAPHVTEKNPSYPKDPEIAPKTPHIIQIPPMMVDQQASAAPHVSEKNPSYSKNQKNAPQTSPSIPNSFMALNQAPTVLHFPEIRREYQKYSRPSPDTPRRIPSPPTSASYRKEIKKCPCPSKKLTRACKQLSRAADSTSAKLHAIEKTLCRNANNLNVPDDSRAPNTSRYQTPRENILSKSKKDENEPQNLTNSAATGTQITNEIGTTLETIPKKPRIILTVPKPRVRQNISLQPNVHNQQDILIESNANSKILNVEEAISKEELHHMENQIGPHALEEKVSDKQMIRETVIKSNVRSQIEMPKIQMILIETVEETPNDAETFSNYTAALEIQQEPTTNEEGDITDGINESKDDIPRSPTQVSNETIQAPPEEPTTQKEEDHNQCKDENPHSPAQEPDQTFPEDLTTKEEEEITIIDDQIEFKDDNPDSPTEVPNETLSEEMYIFTDAQTIDNETFDNVEEDRTFSEQFGNYPQDDYPDLLYYTEDVPACEEEDLLVDDDPPILLREDIDNSSGFEESEIADVSVRAMKVVDSALSSMAKVCSLNESYRKVIVYLPSELRVTPENSSTLGYGIATILSQFSNYFDSKLIIARLCLESDETQPDAMLVVDNGAQMRQSEVIECTDNEEGEYDIETTIDQQVPYLQGDAEIC